MTHKQNTIKEMAKDIRKKMVGSTLFGEPIDFDNTEMVIVAAYGLAQGEEISRYIRESKITRKLINS